MSSFDIPFTKADINEQDESTLMTSLRSGNISGNGPYTNLAEEFINSKIGSVKTLLTTSCSHALEMAALLSHLQAGDEVIVPAYTFVTTASSFALHGARPIFVDVHPETLNLDPRLVEQAITKKTKAICVVHYGGVSHDIDILAKIAETNNLILIEDNAHGLFTKFRGKYLGTFGALATQSFHATKNITCGEGGALIINDAKFVERAEILREKGTDRSRFLRGQVDKYTWVDCGSSWVMSDLLASILLSQLGRFEMINHRRREIYLAYTSNLTRWAQHLQVKLPFDHSDCANPGHLFHLRFQSADLRYSFMEFLANKGIQTAFHYQPLNTSQYGRSLGGFQGQCPIAENAGDCLVRLPMFQSMTENQVGKVIDAVTSFNPSRMTF